MASLKGPGERETFDGRRNTFFLYLFFLMKTTGAGLRVAIVHARWNTVIIDALVAGARKSLVEAGVAEQNIVVESVPGSYELPYAVQRSVNRPFQF